MAPTSSRTGPLPRPRPAAQSALAEPADVPPTGKVPVGVGERVCGAFRLPQQPRGERRVQVILDAAAALIAEGGTERLTVQMLADRAKTSKGSLYHFFPDLPGVIRALADRHFTAVSALTDAMIADESIAWRELSVEGAVECLLCPLSYLAANPDLLALVRAPMEMESSARRLMPIRDLAAHLLAMRCPALAAEQRLAVAATMVGMLDGVVGYALRTSDVSPGRMKEELRRALVAYLSAVELASATTP